MEKNVVCAKCGALNFENAKFCNKCGSEIPVINEMPMESETPKKKSKKLIIIGLAGALAVFLVILFTVIIPKAKDKAVKNAIVEKFNNLNVGDEVTFGMYEQDGNDASKEMVEWIVLDKQDGRYLLLSKYVLDTVPYHSENAYITWEKSYVREWLNDDFYNNVFADSEKTLIENSSIKGDFNSIYYVHGGKDTIDNVFLLSTTEVEYYYDNKMRRPCKATQYAINQDVYVDEYGWCRWWLRTPGRDMNYSTLVEIDLAFEGYKLFDNGDINFEGRDNTYSGIGIRPAIWVNIGTDKNNNNSIPTQEEFSGGIGEI